MSSAVSAFRGPPPPAELTGRARARDDAPVRQARRPTETPLVAPVAARVATMLALVAFGVLHWMLMLEDAATFRAGYALAIAVLVAAALIGVARLHGPARWGALAATVVVAAVLALLAGGVGADELRPGGWGALWTAITGGVQALPGARIPYRGLDEQVQLVIPLGGTVLATLGALLACWPRSRGRTGFTAPALVVLVGLYAVPAVALVLGAEFLRGALLVLLVVAFLRLDRLRRRDAPAAAGVLCLAAIVGLLAAPALDHPDPWWDYEDWSQEAAGARSTTFDWDHDYARLAWPRDGRELLRVQSKQRAYWKTDELDVFDGQEWVRDRLFNGHDSPGVQFLGVRADRLRRWSFPLKVTVRNLRSETLPLAGAVDDVTFPGRQPLQVRAGIWGVGRPIHRGDAYRARAYVPQPSAGDLENAPTAYDYDLARYTSLTVVPTSGIERGIPRRVITDGFFGSDPNVISDQQQTAAQLLDRSRLRRAYALAERLKAGAATPYDYLKAVERHLGGNQFSYSEAPPPASRTLDGFLFVSHVGFCQQYSGAMALLLRLGGIPARVATGFAPGSYDRRSKEYVVRDFDAHSWVEAWFNGIGWVTFDPTPAAAPPRSQATLSAPSAANGDVRDLGTTQADPLAPASSLEDGVRWERYVWAAFGLVLLAFGVRAFWRWRHRPHPAAVSELERALRGIGEPLAPGATLTALEARFAGSPSALGYLDALRVQRYAPRGGRGPTAAQRRGLRRALGRGRGPVTRLRAWFALPPRLPRRGLH